MALAVSTRGWDKRGRTAAAVMATQPGMGASPWGASRRDSSSAGRSVTACYSRIASFAAIASLAAIASWPPLHHCIDAPAPTRRAPLSLSPWRPVAKAGIAVRSETSPAPQRIGSRASRGSASGIAGSAPALHAPSLIATGRQPTGSRPQMGKHRGSAIAYAVALAFPGSSEKRLVRLIQLIASHLIKVYGKVASCDFIVRRESLSATGAPCGGSAASPTRMTHSLLRVA
jgi:hypothetical protein